MSNNDCIIKQCLCCRYNGQALSGRDNSRLLFLGFLLNFFKLQYRGRFLQRISVNGCGKECCCRSKNYYERKVSYEQRSLGKDFSCRQIHCSFSGGRYSLLADRGGVKRLHSLVYDPHGRGVSADNVSAVHPSPP